jgi:hypothetical protein
LIIFGTFAVFTSQAKANAGSQPSVVSTTNASLAFSDQQMNRSMGNNEVIPPANESHVAISEDEATSSNENTVTITPDTLVFGTVDNQQIDNESIVKTVQALAQKQMNLLLGKPGWLHIQLETTIAPDFTGSDSLVSPSGQSVFLPNPLTQDSWYHLDELGDVVEGWGQILTAEGLATQESVYIAKNWVNLTFKEAGYESSDYKSYEPHLVINLPTQDAASWFTSSLAWKTTSATMEAYAEDGHYVVTVVITFSEPMENVFSLQEAITGGQDTYLFDSDTGQLLSIERYVLTESGELLFAGQDRYTATEFLTDLPTDVATRFNTALNLAAEE